MSHYNKLQLEEVITSPRALTENPFYEVNEEVVREAFDSVLVRPDGLNDRIWIVGESATQTPVPWKKDHDHDLTVHHVPMIPTAPDSLYLSEEVIANQSLKIAGYLIDIADTHTEHFVSQSSRLIKNPETAWKLKIGSLACSLNLVGQMAFFEKAAETGSTWPASFGATLTTLGTLAAYLTVQHSRSLKTEAREKTRLKYRHQELAAIADLGPLIVPRALQRRR